MSVVPYTFYHDLITNFYKLLCKHNEIYNKHSKMRYLFKILIIFPTSWSQYTFWLKINDIYVIVNPK